MMLDKFEALIGKANTVTGADMERWSADWTGNYSWTPLAVLRPGSTEEVAAIVSLANETGTPIVPVSGNTGLAGGTYAQGAIMLSLERMNRIREIRKSSRIAIVEAGVVLSRLHEAADAEDLIFPLTFGARGSTMVGGFLSTNAGGSNVLRYGNTRDLCLGLEIVLPNGEIMNLMSELHKDNSGYNLKHLMIGAEGTLGIITGAVLKLSPKPRAYATAMVAMPSVDQALDLLNRLQETTGGGVEAFEYMPRSYIEQHLIHYPAAKQPFETMHDVNILVEVGATSARDTTPAADGRIPVAAHLEDVLEQMFEQGDILDAVVAQSQAQRAEMWERREAAGSLLVTQRPLVNNDIAVPLDKVAVFLERIHDRLAKLDAGAKEMVVSHLGDGNVHYAVWPQSQDPQVHDAIMETVEDVVLELGGSFSAEHGIGLSKRPSMARRKNKAALGVMRAIKAALDPKGIMNPGKVLPD